MAKLEERVGKIELGHIALEKRIDKMDADVIGHVTEMQAFMLAAFAKVDRQFKEVDQRFDRVDQRFDGVDQRFDAMDKRFDAIDVTLNRVMEKMDVFIETQSRINRDVESRLTRRTSRRR